jgi:hypothetical protein
MKPIALLTLLVIAALPAGPIAGLWAKDGDSFPRHTSGRMLRVCDPGASIPLSPCLVSEGMFGERPAAPLFGGSRDPENDAGWAVAAGCRSHLRVIP